jgi:hypothetical protein
MRWTSDTGSLPMAVLLTLVGTSLTGLLLPIVLGQLQATRTAADRIYALQAAEAGIQVALGEIRAAVDGSGAGIAARLPCDSLEGTVSATGTARYQVSIDYYRTDPRGKTSAALAADRLDCGELTSETPAFARLIATGEANAAVDRAVQATYTFHTASRNIPGGTLAANTPTGVLCLDAGSATPAPGASVLLQVCDDALAQQRFAYSRDLTLSLLSSKSGAYPGGLCLDAGPIPVSTGTAVKLEKCAGQGPGMAQQEWGFDGQSSFRGSTDGRNTDGLCFAAPNVIGGLLVLRPSPSACLVFGPDPGIGAGRAGEQLSPDAWPGVRQLVNYHQFSRCLDVPNGDTSSLHLIAWPCKQAPDPNLISWNEKWRLLEPQSGRGSQSGPITVTGPDPVLGTVTSCLVSPRSTARGTYLRVAPCAPGPDQDWTRFAETSLYATSYTVVDSAGYCMTVTDPDAIPPDLYRSDGFLYSKIILAVCDGSADQKWNARPDVLERMRLTDLRED